MTIKSRAQRERQNTDMRRCPENKRSQKRQIVIGRDAGWAWSAAAAEYSRADCR